jgi:hypothetical protein
MEPVKFLVAVCACVFTVCLAIKDPRAQQFVYPAPPPPPPIFNPSSPNTAPQMRGIPVVFAIAAFESLSCRTVFVK